MLAGVNALALRPGWGGEDRYLRRLLATMRAIQRDTDFVVFTDPANNDSFDGWTRICIDKRMGIAGAMARAAKDARVDLLFTSLQSAPAKFPIPVVVYALDLRFWEEDYLKRQHRRASKLKMAKRICASACALVAPSEFVRRKFLERLEIPLDRVVVAPLGIDKAFGQTQFCPVEQPYLLAVGDTREFKNVPRLCEVFDQMKRELPHSLVVVGRPCEAEPADWGTRVLRIESCPASFLAALYQHCDVYVQPSLYEGSGVTVLEAMRSGASVVTSRTGGIEEIAGETPIFFNPTSTASITAAIQRAIHEAPEHRLERTRFGRQTAAEYTWENCAWKTLAAFKRA